jgi:hypothetical protein
MNDLYFENDFGHDSDDNCYDHYYNNNLIRMRLSKPTSVRYGYPLSTNDDLEHKGEVAELTRSHRPMTIYPKLVKKTEHKEEEEEEVQKDQQKDKEEGF